MKYYCESIKKCAGCWENAQKLTKYEKMRHKLRKYEKCTQSWTNWNNGFTKLLFVFLLKKWINQIFSLFKWSTLIDYQKDRIQVEFINVSHVQMS